MTRAEQFSFDAHESIGQVRKFNGEPYWKHPRRVRDLLLSVGVTDEAMLNASLYHDIIEDVFPEDPLYGLDSIIENFGIDVADLTLQLTDVFTKEAYPAGNRKVRKASENVRMSLISDRAKIIKVADISDNSASMPFSNSYWHREKAVLVPLLKPRDEHYLDFYERLVASITKESA